MNEHTPINPELLIWARKSAGFTIESAVKAINQKKITADVLKSWEAGTAQPTYTQLEKLAYKIYRRPVALFFFPEPPKEQMPEESFRTLTVEITNDLSPNMRFLLRRAQSFQISITELADNINPSDNFLLDQIEFDVNDLNMEEMTSSIRKYFGVDIEEQSSWSNTEVALKKWRMHIELGGIFVFKDSFSEENISGFCLHDETFPLIYVNNNNTKTRQIFTLFHELAHMLFRTGGVDFRRNIDEKYIERLEGNNRTIEIICNKFASEFLVPDMHFRKKIKYIRKREIEKKIEELAKFYSVSREVILRKFFDMQYVNQEFYNKKVEEWNNQIHSGSSSGGDYYLTKNTYLSDVFKELAFKKYTNGKITKQELSDYTGVKVGNLDNFEAIFLSSTASG